MIAEPFLAALPSGTKGRGHLKSTAIKIGGGAGLGPLIDALADGAEGALIGGLAGAGVGRGAAAATGRYSGEVAAEGIYTFRPQEDAQPD